MKFLVAGLGSMGKRRVRCLKALGMENIAGYDPREDRRRQSRDTYGITVLEEYTPEILAGFNALVVSTPPDRHLEYLRHAVDRRLPVFVEASVILQGLPELETARRKNSSVVAPSCTMRFHPAIKRITALVKDETFGKVANFSYHSGQFLPDWHPWERVTDFYVSQKDTGAAREIVPFELTWLCNTFGFPSEARGFKLMTMDVGASIDDSYACVLQGEGFVGTLLVDVVSRHATRSLIVNCERGQIRWAWELDRIDMYDADLKTWRTEAITAGPAHPDYNANIGEQMYIDELDAFIRATTGKGRYPNPLEDDIRVLQLLEQIETTR